MSMLSIKRRIYVAVFTFASCAALPVGLSKAAETVVPGSTLKDLPSADPTGDKSRVLDQLPDAGPEAVPDFGSGLDSKPATTSDGTTIKSGEIDPAQVKKEKDSIIKDTVGEEDPSNAQIFSPADMATLDREVGVLKLLVSELEKKVAKLEAERGTIKAPFKVVDTSGFALLLVDESGATFSSFGGGTTNIQLKQGQPPQIYLGNQAGGLSLEGGETNRITVVNGDTSVFELKADAGQGIMMSGKTSEGEFQLGSGPELVGIVIKKDGQPAAGLGTAEGRGVALRMYDKSGQVVAAAGENPAAAGTGIVYVGNGSKNGAALAADGDGSGVVHAFNGDGTVGAGLIGKERLVGAYNASGTAVATLQKSDKSEGGTIRARDPSGEAVFSTGFRSDLGGGEACVIRNKRGGNVFCLGLGVPGFGTVR